MVYKTLTVVTNPTVLPVPGNTPPIVLPVSSKTSRTLTVGDLPLPMVSITLSDGETFTVATNPTVQPVPGNSPSIVLQEHHRPQQLELYQLPMVSITLCDGKSFTVVTNPTVQPVPGNTLPIVLPVSSGISQTLTVGDLPTTNG